MPANTDRRRRKLRRQAVLGAAMFILLQLACTACFGALCLIPNLPRWAGALFAVLAALCAGLIIPALVVLKQRFAEIEGGEFHEAFKY